MLLIQCPWCGGREQTEFSYHGEAHIVRPPSPDTFSDEEWAAYLFMRKNPKGVHYERWMHAFGCRRFFNLARHTVSGHMYGAYPMGGDKPPTAVAAQAAETNK
ncbi:MAG: sarcosine oxidase subunit delta [Gammaproteobacteria bacterium WSBS_2016_MAG_OTU1]